MWSRSRASPYQRGMQVSGCDGDAVLGVAGFDATVAGIDADGSQGESFAVGLDRGEFAVGFGDEVPAAFVDQPVVMPTQLGEVGEPVLATAGAPADVMHVGERALPTAREATAHDHGPAPPV